MKQFILSLLIGGVAMLLLRVVDDLNHSYIPEFDEDIMEQICTEEGIE